MKNLNLEIQISGQVQTSNFEDFEEKALAAIGDINLELVTDNDFVEAKKLVKICSEIETKLHNAKQQAIHQTVEISKLFTMIDKLDGKVREIRLSTNREVKVEEIKRKKEIIDAGILEAKNILKNSNVSHANIFNINSFHEAAKNKRSLTKLQEAITGEVNNFSEIIAATDVIFEANMLSITEAEKEFPGLFPDKKEMALKDCGLIAEMINSRVNEFKFRQAEKERIAKERAEAEEERIAKAKEEAEKEQSAPEEAPPKEAPKIADNPFTEPTEEPTPPPVENTADDKNRYTITAHLHCTRDEALVLLSLVEKAVSGNKSVNSIVVDKA